MKCPNCGYEGCERGRMACDRILDETQKQVSELHKEKYTINRIFEELCENKPTLNGRSYMKYARELATQRDRISDYVCSVRAMRQSNVEVNTKETD